MKTAIVCAAAMQAQTSVNESAPSASPSPVITGSDGKSEVEKTNIESKKSRYVSKTEAARIPRFETAPVIDGQLHDAVWQACTT